MTPGRVDRGQVHIGDGGDVVDVRPRRSGDRSRQIQRPTTTNDQFGVAGHGHVGRFGGRPASVEQRRQRHLTGRVARFEEAHRSHRQTGEATGAAVSAGVVERGGGTGEDVQPGALLAVDLGADVVPHASRVELPLVDELGWITGQHQGRVDAQRRACLVVSIEGDAAGGLLFGGERLPARLRAFEQHRARGREPVGQQGVDHTGAIHNHNGRLHTAGTLDYTTRHSGATVCRNLERLVAKETELRGLRTRRS